MALTAKQRRALPREAFIFRSGPRSNWAYPIPTKAQARKAGISERQRIGMARSARAFAARRDTRGTPGRINRYVAKRMPAKAQPASRRGRSRR